MHCPSLFTSTQSSILTSSFGAAEIQRTLLHLADHQYIGWEKVRRNGPNQHLSQVTRALAVHVLIGAGKLEVHIAVHADKGSAVFGLSPL